MTSAGVECHRYPRSSNLLFMLTLRALCRPKILKSAKIPRNDTKGYKTPLIQMTSQAFKDMSSISTYIVSWTWFPWRWRSPFYDLLHSACVNVKFVTRDMWRRFHTFALRLKAIDHKFLQCMTFADCRLQSVKNVIFSTRSQFPFAGPCFCSGHLELKTWN